MKMFFSYRCLLAFFVLSITVQTASAQNTTTSPQYIFAFDDFLLKDLISRNQSALKQTLIPLLKSDRERTLATKTVNRLKRKVIGNLAKGKQKKLSLIDAKLLTARDGTVVSNDKLNYAVNSGLIKYIVPNIRLSVFKTSNDPELSKLWAVKNSESGFSSVPDVDINADEAWDIRTDSGDAAVGVLDTGINPDVADLKPNLWVNNAEIPGNNVDDDKNGYIDDITGCNFIDYETGSSNNCGARPHSTHNHGTHVAGTIGASGNNGTGVAGVVWRTKMVSLSFLGNDGSGSLSDMIEAMEYAVDLKNIYKNSGGQKGANIKVINASLGHNDGFLQAEYDAIKALDKADILYVAAAGNGGLDGFGDNNDQSPTYPASYDLPNIISVAAVNRGGKLTVFSNYGAGTVHIAAPGDKIVSTVFDNKYQAMSGTSMAAPLVAGAAALIRGHKPDMPAWMVKQVLIASVKDESVVKNLSSLNGKVSSSGMLDVKEALILSEQNFDKPIITKQPKDLKGYINGKAAFTVNVIGQAPFVYKWQKDGKPVSDKASISFTSLSAGDAGFYTCTISNNFGSVTSNAVELKVSELTKGDLNADGLINVQDMIVFMSSIGQKGKNLPADLNKDGTVDLNDLLILMSSFNKF